jgi:tRNA-dihydrouridine synthase B
MEQLIGLYVEYFGEETACRMLRSRLVWFVKGMPGCSTFRRDLSAIKSADQARTLILAYEESRL